MSLENPFSDKSEQEGKKTGKPEKGEETKNPKALFLTFLEKELSNMVESGRISKERAIEKMNSALLIETGFSDNPAYDALIFSKAGVADEEELSEIFDRKNAETELVYPENSLVDDSIADFIKVTESARRAYYERIAKGVSKAEKLELLQAILFNRRVQRYFEKILPRIKAGETVEEIIEKDKNIVEKRKNITDNDETLKSA